MAEIVIVALYKFVPLPDYEGLRHTILEACQANSLKGTLLVAREGINGTIAGNGADIDRFLSDLRTDRRFADIDTKRSYAEEPPFHRMKVKLKKEIVTIGLPQIDPTEKVGTYVKPADWNALISDPNVTLIDTRNDYEFGVGTFENAINPDTFSFREFPAYVEQNLDPNVHKKVAMFCTGGIRCEKATSLLLEMGFKEVFHLQGGILKYLEEVPQEESLWSGECFVFDDRVTVDHDLKPGSYLMCFACKRPLASAETAHPDYEEGVSCRHCIHETSPTQRAAFAERHRQVKLAEARGQQHIGRDDGPRE